ncbi:MAG: GNAT family protein [Anaerolineaceae bacterium]|nr:GNAT family protein [Anaerolineaceae bacterium]
MHVRPITPEDSQAFIQLRLQLDEETRFMLLEPGERRLDPQQEHQRITSLLDKDEGMIFVAADEAGRLAGFLSIQRGAFRRVRHKAHIVIGILEAFTGQGLGTRCFQAAEEWARRQGIHRLELTVMTHNQRALALYRKMGFEIEGTLRHSMRVDGVYVDEYSLARLLT